ncbi:hypothetical protein BG60_23680 [Caballeronia zhejiangensis]|uniref:Purine nucleoside phosphorylase n=2 Tax=Burkholderiaceae TaxID=119060 RepID=A0A656QD84_9BURK|nr:hypothetical protein BURK_009041 [Burkholderia sp. SJ98]KDR26290.1 hypothetical protein BG60_23680 [Caballeronia zhejiangensis]
MKTLFAVATLLSTALVAAAAQGQTSAPLTREQVRSELAELAGAGYRPTSDDPNYPSDIQSAEARLSAQPGRSEANSGHGGSFSGAQQAGGPAAVGATQKDIFFGQ